MFISRTAKEIIERNKIKLTGTGMNSKNEYYEVCKIKIHYIKSEDKYECSCRDCSTVRIPNKLPPRCVYVEALKTYRKCHTILK